MQILFHQASRDHVARVRARDWRVEIPPHAARRRRAFATAFVVAQPTYRRSSNSLRCKAALCRRRRGRPREKEAVLMLAAAAAAATAAASATAAAASAICRPACVDAADGKRAVHPVPESDIRELRKKLKPHVSRPVDPVLQRTPSERFPCWSEGSAGIDAASIVRSSSRALGSGSYGSVEPVSTLDRPGQRLAMKIVSAKSIGSDSSASDSSASDRVKEALSDAARELKLLQDNESPFLMTAVGGGGVVLHSTNGTLAASSCPEQHVGVAMLMEEMAGDLSSRVLKMGALPDAHETLAGPHAFAPDEDFVALRYFDDSDDAVEWCSNELLFGVKSERKLNFMKPDPALGSPGVPLVRRQSKAWGCYLHAQAAVDCRLGRAGCWLLVRWRR